MGFDLNKFSAAKVAYRTDQVPVPELAAFFDEGEPNEFTVRNLDAAEFGRVMDEVNANKKAMVKALASASQSGVREAIMAGIQEYMSHDDDTLPDDYIKRVYLIEFGTVDPVLTHDAVLKIAKNAEVFWRLSNKILKLTGMGPDLGESKGSGKSPASRPRSRQRPPETSTEG